MNISLRRKPQRSLSLSVSVPSQDCPVRNYEQLLFLESVEISAPHMFVIHLSRMLEGVGEG